MYGMRKLILLSVMLCITGASGVRAQRYDRGFERSSIAFVEKGTWTAGGSVAYSAHKNDNYRFFVIEDINSTGYRFSLNPGFCYIVRDNMGLGARFSYGRQLLKVERANISIDEIDINVKDYYALSHDYSVMAIYRNYIPIGNSRRFAIYSEMQIGLGGGQAKLLDGHKAEVLGTYEKSVSASIGVCPGMVAFINNHFAVEFNVGMLGLKYTHVDQVHNQKYTGDRRTAQINFKINILAIGFGHAYYL